MNECDTFAILRSKLVLSESNDPMVRSILLAIGFTILVQITSMATHNYSQVDKLWSIVPVVYAISLAYSPRGILMAALGTLWGIRLTYNFYRRGGYTFPCIWRGDEDYRWEYIRKGGFVTILTNKTVWGMFNLIFISIYQNLLLWWIAAGPSIVVYCMDVNCGDGVAPLALQDYILTALFLLLLILETLADQQQFEFQTEKHRQRREQSHDVISGDYRDGFCQSGLFAMVRKPNYAAEQGLWLIYFGFTTINNRSIWNWSLLGWIQLVLLFQTSGWLTEKITLEKYPSYARYQRNVPLYIPFAKGWCSVKSE